MVLTADMPISPHVIPPLQSILRSYHPSSVALLLEINSLANSCTVDVDVCSESGQHAALMLVI